jgi:hypothetical protein
MQWRDADLAENVGTWIFSGLMALGTVVLVYYFSV